MKLFLDTNVILDAMFPEREAHEYADAVLSLTRDDGVKLFTSSLTIANICYISRKRFTKKEWIKRVKGMLDNWKIVAICDNDIYEASKSNCPDFEDAMQISAAEVECDVIVTDDVKHFKGYTFLPVFTPEEFLSRLASA